MEIRGLRYQLCQGHPPNIGSENTELAKSLRKAFENASVSYKDPTEMDRCIFQWVKRVVIETKDLRKRHKRILFTLDGYGGNVTSRYMHYLKCHNIELVALTAHKSHRTQVPDYTEFSPYTPCFRYLLNERAIVGESDLRKMYITYARS